MRIASFPAFTLGVLPGMAGRVLVADPRSDEGCRAQGGWGQYWQRLAASGDRLARPKCRKVKPHGGVVVAATRL